MSGQYTIETRWRQGLERKGRDWVIRTLQTRTGQPDDAVLDVVFEEPYPTRDFCQRWCVEQDNKVGGAPIATKVAILLMVGVIIAGVMFGIRGLEHGAGFHTSTSDTH